MIMLVAVFMHIVVMRVRVDDGVTVRRAVVRVDESMCVQVRMTLKQGIEYHERSPERHNEQSAQKPGRQRLAQKDKRQKHADKRSHGIVCAGFRGSNGSLGADIQENAQPIGEKAQNQRVKHIGEFRELFAQQKGDDKGTAAGKQALQNHNFVCAFRGNFPGAVILLQFSPCFNFLSVNSVVFCVNSSFSKPTYSLIVSISMDLLG